MSRGGGRATLPPNEPPTPNNLWTIPPGEGPRASTQLTYLLAAARLL